MINGTVGQLTSLFKNTDGRKPILLLGAGASFRSGIPLSGSALNKIAKASYARSIGLDWKNAQVPPTDFRRYLEEMAWYIPFRENPAEAFRIAVKELLIPTHFRREFLKEMIRYHNINDGYIQLSEIVQRRLCNIILTTNFDSLLIDSFRKQQPNFLEILEINKTAAEILAFDPYKCMIVYLHGAVEYYTDRILDEETQTLDARLLEKIRREINFSPLIVVGYRGAEISIMEKLLMESIGVCEKFPHGIWWCHIGKDKLHSNVLKLAHSIHSNFTSIEIEGFDELMKEINSSTANKFNLYLGEHFDVVSDLSSDIFNFEISELDMSLIQTTLKTYCQRLNLDFEIDKLEEFLVQLSLMTKKSGSFIPTVAGYLMFGKNPEEKIPYSNIQLLNDDTGESILIKGNLLTQFNSIIEYFNSQEINPSILIKKGKTSEESQSYSLIALRELIVNMIVHKDYSIDRYSKVYLRQNVEIVFETPGGLTERILDKVSVDDIGRFKPREGITDYRNLAIADIFCGVRYMEKKGSGLIQAQKEMIEVGGEAEFKIDNLNKTVFSTVRMAKIEFSNIATPIIESEIFTTNLLPITILPRFIYSLPIESYKKLNAELPFENNLSMIISYKDEYSTNPKVYSFYNLDDKIKILNQVDFFNYDSKIETEIFLSDRNNRIKFVALLNQHWRNFIKKFQENGLSIDQETTRKRAYFILKNEKMLQLKISYVSELGRNVSRAVVKKRVGVKSTFCENEGFTYSLEQISNEWFIRIKPFYMFTREDGITPIYGIKRSRLSTRRIKFDKNKNVRDDLIFWSKFLSENKPVFNIGYEGEQNIILSSSFLECETSLIDTIND